MFYNRKDRKRTSPPTQSRADREKYKRSLAWQDKTRPVWEKLADLPVQKLSNREGRSIHAKLTFYDGESVTLKIRGKTFRYPMANLSDESQAI
ncbi:MAG: hypothetical protein GWO24_17615, partial [Akkermansiaceae bacterium]|nr:hypothetical protein [Akkermansiaceae bacterium]